MPRTALVRPLRLLCLTAAIVAASAARADAPGFAWARALGGTSADAVEGIAVDPAGNVYATGLLGTAGGAMGTISGAPVFLDTNGNTDAFITKHDPAGQLVWAHNIGGKQPDSGLAIAAGAAGEVYATGFFLGAVDFDPGPAEFMLELPGNNFGAYLLKLNTNGEFMWAKAIGSLGAARGTRIVVDAAGNVVLAGVFTGTVDFNPGGLPVTRTSNGNEDVFVAKYTADGALLWAVSWGGTAVDWVNGLAVDADGNVHTAGSFAFTVDFDPGPGSFLLTSALASNAFVSKLDKDGNFIWARTFGAAAASDAAVAPDGSVYATGNFNTTRDFNPDPDEAFLMTSAGALDGFLSKFNANGQFQWALRFGSFRNDEGVRVAVGAAGAVYLTGAFDTGNLTSFPATFGPFELLSRGAADTFLAKLDASGEYTWVTQFGGASDDTPRDLVVDSRQAIHLGGSFLLSGNFHPTDTATLTSNGNRDGFLVKLTQGAPPTMAGDINGDGQVNAVDVQLVINAALGLAIEQGFIADINGDGLVNAVDVQLVINAALGIGP